MSPPLITRWGCQTNLAPGSCVSGPEICASRRARGHLGAVPSARICMRATRRSRKTPERCWRAGRARRAAAPRWASHDADIHFTFVMEGDNDPRGRGAGAVQTVPGRCVCHSARHEDALCESRTTFELLEVSLPGVFDTTMKLDGIDVDLNAMLPRAACAKMPMPRIQISRLALRSRRLWRGLRWRER